METPGQKCKDISLLILSKKDYFAKKNEVRKQSKVEMKLNLNKNMKKDTSQEVTKQDLWNERWDVY